MTIRPTTTALLAAQRAGIHEADWPSRPQGVDASAAADLLDRVRARGSRPMALERPVHLSPARWAAVLAWAEERLGREVMVTWLRPLVLDEDGRLLAPSAAHREWVAHNYQAVLVDGLREVSCAA